MKKSLILALALLTAFSAFGQMTVLWESSEANSSLPGWFDTSNLTRGFAYGNIGGNDRLIVVSRNGGNNLFVLDAATGDSLSMLDASGITGGTYHISDAGVSADGDIYVCNLALNTTLKVYKWDAVDASPSVVIEHPYTSGRAGDKMSVYGSAADNSLTLLFGDASNDQVLRFTTADNGATFAPDTIQTDQHGGSASAALTDDGALYHNASGVYVKRYDGTVSTQVSGGVCGTGTNAIEFLFNDGESEYVSTFQYGGGNENARILKVPEGDLTAASTYALTPTLGSNSNGNGAGDVAVKDNGDGTYTVFVLSCNNGLGAYTLEFPVPPVEPLNMSNVMEVWGGDYGFFLDAGDACRGMGYNPATDHILVASRAGGSYVHVLDAQSGAALDTLDMTGVTGGFYGISLMKADAADDGVIYACNLASNGDFKIYRWENESAAPTVALTQSVTSRFGDVFELAGSGTDTKIYASARGGTEIKVFGTDDGVNFAEVQSVPITAGAADGGISVVDETTLWVNGAWKNCTKIDTAGTVLTSTSVPENYYGNVLYIKASNGSELLAVNANHQDGERRKMKVYNITRDEVSPELWALAETGNIERSNGNVAGNIKYKRNTDGTVTVYQMTTNNAIATWVLEVPEFVEITDIADAKVDDDNDDVPDHMDSVMTVQGTVFTPNYVSGTSLYIQDVTDGINVFSYSVNNTFESGDIIEVTGEIDQYNGLTQIAISSADDMKLIGTGAAVTPQVITLADLGESLESNYVKAERVWLVDPSQWPDEGSDANLDVTDGTDTVTFRIDADSDLDGMPAPSWEFDLVGVASQFTFSSPPDDGYQIIGTFYEDLTIYSPILSELDENFESWTELDPEWDFENIRLADDDYALEGNGKYLGLANLDSAGMVMTPYIEDPQQLTFHLSEHTGGSDVWDFNVVLVNELGDIADTLFALSAPGDFDWHKHTADIYADGVYAVKFVTENVTSGSSYIDHISVKAPPAEPEIAPASLDFATVGINAGKTLSAKLANAAPLTGETLLVDSLVVNHADFIAVMDTQQVAPGDSAQVWVSYMPKDETADNAVLSVYTNAGIVTADLCGNGELIWPLNWRVTADTDWMGETANAPRTMAYSTRTNHLYFVTHPGGYGDHLKAVDAENGAFIKDLSLLEPLPSAGYIKINAVAATQDGQVFSCNLSSGSTFNLFRNADEDAEMNLAYGGDGIPVRVGDALAACGEGTSTRVFVSGTGAPNIYVFSTTDGENFSLTDSIAVAAGAASRGIAPVGDGSYFFINGTGSAPQYISDDGTVLHTFDTGRIPSGTAINYFEVEVSDGMRRFAGITNGWSSGTQVVELLGDPGDNLCSSLDIIEAPTDNYSTNANLNATGLAVYNPFDNALIELITNNGVSAYSLEKIESDPVIPERDTTAVASALPENFRLYQNYPNPFNPVTTIRFDLPEDAMVDLSIYDITGRKVRTLVNEQLRAGYNRVVWNGIDSRGNALATGLYIYKLQAGENVEIKKMTYVK